MLALGPGSTTTAPDTTAAATTVGVSSADAANQVMDRTAAAETAAEQSGNASHVVKKIEGTAQDIYQSKIASIDGKGKDS